MSVTVKYKGSAIAELTENGTKTLKTSGKYCEADIVVENTKDGGTQVTDGIVVKARSAEGFPTEADVYGDLYPYQFSYDGTYYHGTIGWRSLSKLTLKSGQTVLKEGCFAYLPLVQVEQAFNENYRARERQCRKRNHCGPAHSEDVEDFFHFILRVSILPPPTTAGCFLQSVRTPRGRRALRPIFRGSRRASRACARASTWLPP